MGWFVTFVVLLMAIVAVALVRAKPKRLGANARVAGNRTTPSRASRESKRAPQAFPLRWFGPDSELQVAGMMLRGACVYASSGQGHANATDPSEILVQQPVRRPSSIAPPFGYWPWYSRLSPEQRYEYLAWLASGKKELPRSDGYLFLYFYGIERRLLVDEADRTWGLQEIVRLRRLDAPRAGTKEGRSFRQYSTGLLWYEIARTPSRFDRKALDLVCGLTERWSPEMLTAPLAWAASREEPLPATLAREIASVDVTAQRSVVTERVPEEFNELFATRYLERYGGEGIRLRVSKREAWQTHRPASGGLDEMRIRVPNPLGIKSQFKELPKIWNSCIADLRKLSRISTSQVDDELTVDAWEAMPEDLRADVDHPLSDRVTSVLSEYAGVNEDDSADDSTVLAPAGRFAELLELERRPKLTASQSRNLAATVEHTGYGLTPDARITPVRYGWDELVAVTPGLDDNDVEAARYNAAAFVLRLGLSIALADGHADEMEQRVLMDHIDAVFGLSDEEQRRLGALRTLLLGSGVELREFSRRVREMIPPDARRSVGRLLVVIAAETDGIDRSERAALRRAFKSLDLSPELLEETIREVAPDADDSVVVMKTAKAPTARGEVIPAPSSEPAFRLNHEAISSIMEETRSVSNMLAEAMGVAVLEEDQPPEESELSSEVVRDAAEVAVQHAGPGGRYEPLYARLIEQKRWDRGDAEGVARGMGLMLDAGVETINDWAFDALGAPLIEDEGSELIVDRSLLSKRA